MNMSVIDTWDDEASGQVNLLGVARKRQDLLIRANRQDVSALDGDCFRVRMECVPRKYSAMDENQVGDTVLLMPIATT
jgi:hypothetical protein